MKMIRCKYFTHRILETHRCRKKINVRELVGGEGINWYKRIPCSCSKSRDTYCDFFELSDCDKLTKQIRAIKEQINIVHHRHQVINKVNVLVKHYNKEGKGFMKCPVCKGVLDYGVQKFTGKTYGSCETPDCISWME